MLINHRDIQFINYELKLVRWSVFSKTRLVLYWKRIFRDVIVTKYIKEK
jgi:hypothetical protein